MFIITHLDKNMQRKTAYEYEKPSRHRQWHERAAYSATPQVIRITEIDEIRRNLALSYQLREDDIDFEYKVIDDTEDDDRDDCLWLLFIMQYVVNGQVSYREIFKLKSKAPDDFIQRVKEKEYREKLDAARNPNAKRNVRRGVRFTQRQSQTKFTPPGGPTPASPANGPAPAQAKPNPLSDIERALREDDAESKRPMLRRVRPKAK